MARYQVSYTQSQVDPTPAFPNRTSTARPILPVFLINGGLLWPCYAIVDSGADDIIFPSSFATKIGLNPTQGAFYPFSGAGSANQVAWFFTVTLGIGTVITYQVSVGFAHALDATGMGLLGQNGFFDRFKLDFDLRNGVFYIDEP